MSALRLPAQNAPRPAVQQRHPIPRLASADDQAVASPAAALQADLASRLAIERSPRRWRLNVFPLLLIAVSAGLWWGIIAGVASLLRG